MNSDQRKIVLSQPLNPKKGGPCSNKVVTTKYTLLTFFPRNLLEQFSRVANIYFLLIVVLQMIPEVRSTSPVFAILPLAIILSISAIKDALEDWRRFVADKALNSSTTLRLFNGSWIKTRWEHILVGDIIRLCCDESVPADIVILHSCDEANICYTETKSLDGETNLKLRRALLPVCSKLLQESNREIYEPSEIVEAIKSSIDGQAGSRISKTGAQFIHENPELWEKLTGELTVEKPGANLYSFNGSLTLKSCPNVLCTSLETTAAKISHEENNLRKAPTLFEKNASEDEKTYSVNMENMMLRGCVLRNTSTIVGTVVYTGMESKIMLNSGRTPSKTSKIDRKMNPEVAINFAILFLMCLSCATLSAIFGTSSNVLGYTYSISSNVSVALSSFLNFLAALVVLQNIVPISLYISVEFVKSFQAYFIYCDSYFSHKGKGCIPKRWNISDDLGQIKYIFSDKTGTLTQNLMEFKKCCIDGKIYFGDVQEFRNEQQKKCPNPYIGDNQTFGDAKLLDDILSPNSNGFLETATRFWQILSICHTVVVKEDSKSFPIYNAQSPDEAALVSTARDMGFVFLGRETNYLNVFHLDQKYVFELLHIIEFNSTRKRMSVVVKDPNSRIFLFTKGADSVIFKRLRSGQEAHASRVFDALEEFARDGLRTLCLAYKEFDDATYRVFAKKFITANEQIIDREHAVELVADEYERDLILAGATAIEDKLQEGVPQAIETLSKANIHIWMLTGDKTETAINIGYSCNLLTVEMPLMIISGGAGVNDQIRKSLSTDKKTLSSAAVVIDGDALAFALSPENKSIFLELCVSCKHVICCRVSPLQKAQVVQLVKNSLKVITLAIGDGANDVSMIQEADIGVGISGEEGMQAVLSSDYAISQFRHLLKLVLVHGRWSNLRTSTMVYAFFYKNIVWVLVMYWYQYYAGY